MESEHRRTPRYQLVAEAEVTEILTNTRVVSKTSDLSLSGCFLDTLNPSPVGTDIRVKISYKSTTFTALGKVIFALPNFGMGIEFRNVEDDQLAILQKWISELSWSG